MSSFPNSPHLVKGGIVLLDSQTVWVQKSITLQSDSDSLSRTSYVQVMERTV